jgi:hypothetical protein
MLYIYTVYQRAAHQCLVSAQPYHFAMTLRTDLITASRVDGALILLPIITWWEASEMLAASGVPEDVAARVLVLPLERRPIPLSAFPE